ncbi:MAG: head-tail connector protein [Pseudomonadota bacterium]
MPATLITPPSEEPITLAELKAHLRLENDDEDDLLSRMISAARLHVESITRRVLVEQGWRAYLDRWPVKRKVALPVAPVNAITQVRVYNDAGDASIISALSYTLDPARAPAVLIIRPAVLAPTAYANGIEIDMTCGYGEPSDVPAPLREAVLRLAALWFESRVETGRFNMTLSSSAVEALIAPYKVVWP